MKEGNQSPPRIERLRIKSIAMLRARFSVPPTAATNNPVAAESNAVAMAIRKKPETEPLIATPKTRLPKLKVKKIWVIAMSAVAIILPPRRVGRGMGAALRRFQIPCLRSRNNSSPQSIPQNKRYCMVIPLKLWL